MDKKNKQYISHWRRSAFSLDHQKIEVRGIELEIPPGIFNPFEGVTYSSCFLLDEIPIDLSGKRVMDLGTGSGVISIQCAKNKAISILASDVDKKALWAAQNNLEKHNLMKQVVLCWSDVFDSIGGAKLDYIFANLPILEADFSRLYLKLLNEYENYLNDAGELWLVYASFGDMDKAEKYFDNHPNLIDKIHQSRFDVDWYIYKFGKLDKKEKDDKN